MKYKVNFGFIVFCVAISIIFGFNDDMLAMYSYMIFAMIVTCTRAISIKIDDLKEDK